LALQVYPRLGPEGTEEIFDRDVVQAFAQQQRHATHQAYQANPSSFDQDMSEYVAERQKPAADRPAQVEQELADVTALRQTRAGRMDPALSARKMQLESEKAKLSRELVRIRMEAELAWRVKVGLEAPPPASKAPEDPNVRGVPRGGSERR
jgi:hypothetical protein